ncbi:MAG: T9SS type A sorting domain-containing protein [Saprospiraceae bacterium]|nr:T9SS type A sorting domain-containing protein [Saprospiraceae bacterium]
MKKTILTIIGGFFFYFQMAAQPGFFITDAIPNVGDTFTLDVGVKDFTDLLSTEYTIRWDPSLIAFDGVNNLNLVDLDISDFDFTNVISGYLTIQWSVGNNPDACSDPFADGITIPDSTIIYELNFTAIGPICEQTNVLIDNDPLPIYITRKFVPNPNCLNIGALVDEGGFVSIFTCDWEITEVVNPPSCDNIDDGQIEVVPTGGFGLYSYDWSDDIYDGLSSLENLAPGNYEVTITDELCCESILSFELIAEDLVAPIFQTCPNDTCIALAVGATVGIYDWDLPIAEDNCSASDALTYFSNGYLSGEGIFNIGTTTVEYTASDEAGNLSTACQFDVEMKPSSDLTFYPDTTKAVVNGNCIDVPIKLLNFVDVDSFQLSMRITPQMAIDSVVVLQNPNNSDPVEWEMIDNHVITIHWESSVQGGRTVPDSTTIFGLRIKLLENNDDCKIIRFTNEPVQKWVAFANGFQAVPTTIDRGLCLGPTVGIGGAIQSLTQAPLEGIEVICTDAPTTYTDEDGLYRFDGLDWLGDYEIAPFYDEDPLNGVNVADLVLIRDHLLQQTALPNGYARIAADVNNSGDISLIDLVLIAQLILGFGDVLPTPSWQFVPQAYPIVIPIENNGVPFFVQTAPLVNVVNNRPNINFWGIKMGDVNNSADTDGLLDMPREWLIRDKEFKVGEQFEIKLRPHAEGLQGSFNIHTKQLNILEVVSKEQELLPKSRFQYNNGQFDFLWVKDYHEPEITIRVAALKDGRLSEALSLQNAWAVDDSYQLAQLELAFLPSLPEGEKALKAAKPLQWQPNPFDAQGQFNFNVARAQQLQLTIFDAQGKQVFQQQKDFPKGQNEWLVGEEVFTHAGLYFYQIKYSDHHFQSGKMIKK